MAAQQQYVYAAEAANRVLQMSCWPSTACAHVVQLEYIRTGIEAVSALRSQLCVAAGFETFAAGALM